MIVALGIGLGIAMTLMVLRVVRGPIDDLTDELPRLKTQSRRVTRNLSKDEKLIWETREHPIALWKWWVGLVVLQGLAAVIMVAASFKAAAILWLIGMVVIGYKVLLWDVDRLCITNRRIFTVTGIFSVSVKTMPMKKMTDVTTHFSAASNILAWLRIIKIQYATLIVESAGQDQALSRIKFVPHGPAVNRRIMGTVQ